MKGKLDKYSDSELFSMLKSDKQTAEQAFAELYKRHSARVYAYCVRFLGNKIEAEDVFQETFTKFFQIAKQDKDMTNLSAYLLRIAHNSCLNFKRKVLESVAYEDHMSINSDIPIESNELLELVKSALETLPDEYKEVFILREYNGLAYKDIADVIGESIANTKIRIYRAKQKLRKILQPYIEEFS